MITSRNYLIAISALLLLSLVSPPNKIKVYLIGDSTIADKKPDAFPETGWGTPFKIFFDSTVEVDNRAKNGRSTKSFIAEGLWKPVEGQLKEGDYVFIQFGHNDEVKEKVGRYTTPDEYKTNLRRFITETRAHRASPVLLTPVARRAFDDEGKVSETHKEYSQLVREVAAETKTPLIDLDRKSQELLGAFGPEHSKLLFLQLEPGEHPNYPEGKNDNTHFSELGARKVAQIVLKEIAALRLELSERIINRNQTKP